MSYLGNGFVSSLLKHNWSLLARKEEKTLLIIQPSTVRNHQPLRLFDRA
jgi:hypothetical protein